MGQAFLDLLEINDDNSISGKLKFQLIETKEICFLKFLFYLQ